MTSENGTIAEELDGIREDLKACRDSLGKEEADDEGLDDAILKAGRSIKDAYDDLSYDVDILLAKTIMAARDYELRMEEAGEDLGEEIKEDLRSARDRLRAGRRELTGGHVEDSFRRALEDIEERLDRLVRSFRGEDRE
jgi:hypothetical protein